MNRNETDNQPDSVEAFQAQLQLARQNGQSLAIVGSNSKRRLFDAAEVHSVSTSCFSGIVDHQAEDFTITARAGTPIRDVIDQLATVGQYLPFDPVLADRGATVGGTIAAGINGPSRLRFGGLRDFVIGCQFMDGRGNVIRAGGKVVKNAAGFDLPKFLIGSGGKFGIILEATFKVFPQPKFYQTAVFESDSIAQSIELLQNLSTSNFDFDALEISETHQVVARWSAQTHESLSELGRQLESFTMNSFDLLTGDQDHQFWNSILDFSQMPPAASVVKIPLTRSRLRDFDQRIQNLDATRWYSVAGNVAMLGLNSNDTMVALDVILSEESLTGQTVIGPGPYLIGETKPLPFLQRIKSALDPDDRFGSIENAKLSEVD